jgi:hypothetical protein
LVDRIDGFFRSLLGRLLKIRRLGATGMNEIIFLIVASGSMTVIAIWAVLTGLCAAGGAEPIVREHTVTGGLCGSVAGAILGPVVSIVYMIVLHRLYGWWFQGLELLAGPVIGAVVLAIPGAIIGARLGIRARGRKKIGVETDHLD